MRTFIAMTGAGLLVLSSLTVSEARTPAKRLGPDQGQSEYYRPDNDVRNRDSSCFQSIGPDMYACSGTGGG